MDHFYKLDGCCHCGNIHYRYYSPEPLEALTACACKCRFCTKNGSRYAAHPEGVLIAEVYDADAIRLYRFGTNTSDFYLCGRCGVAPFVTSTIDEEHYAVINANTLEGFCATSANIVQADYSREDLETRLDRRRHPWIGDVTLTYPETPIVPDRNFMLVHT